MKAFNLFFYIILFIGFFLPSNSNFYVPLPGILLGLNELAFITLPILNLLCTSKEKIKFNNFKLRRNILLFVVIILFNEIVIKNLMYGQSLGEAFKAIRIGIPLISSLILVFQGINANVKIVWKVLLWAILTSIFLSFISIFINLPIYYNLESGENLLDENRGRIFNSNASFGLISLYLIFKNKNKWYNKGLLIKIVSILSIVSLILTFNRTYLAILAIEYIYLSFSTLNFRNAFKFTILPLVFIGLSFWSYSNFDRIQRQVDKRIINVLFGKSSLYESTIKDNRDHIYNSMYERIIENHWLIGLPYKKEIFKKEASYNPIEMTKTDVSLYNVLIRYGIIPTVILVIIFRRILKYKFTMFKFIFILLLIASLNIDSLVSHNSIFFLILILFINFYDEKQQQTQNSHNSAYIRT